MSTINLVNLYVFASGLFPLFILIFLFKVVNPKYHGYWVFGVVFIMVAGLLTGSLNLLGGLIEEHAKSLKDSSRLHLPLSCGCILSQHRLRQSEST